MEESDQGDSFEEDEDEEINKNHKEIEEDEVYDYIEHQNKDVSSKSQTERLEFEKSEHIPSKSELYYQQEEYHEEEINKHQREIEKEEEELYDYTESQTKGLYTKSQTERHDKSITSFYENYNEEIHKNQEEMEEEEYDYKESQIQGVYTKSQTESHEEFKSSESFPKYISSYPSDEESELYYSQEESFRRHIYIKQNEYEGEFGGEETEREGEATDICTPEDEYPKAEIKKKSSEEESVSSEILSNVYSKLSPFLIKWSFGVTKTVELINLTTPTNFEIFYASSHFGIVYNYRLNNMTFLPGHNYPISSISADASGRWLVTADNGEDNVIIIWDNKNKVPVWSLYDVFPGEGTRCIKISQDARFLASINCNFNYKLKFWLWTYGQEKPDGEFDIDPSLGKAKHIDFNHMNTEQFAVTMEYNVIFCEWTKTKLNSFSPNFELSKKKFGVLRESLFLDDNQSVITSTSRGQVIVWCDVKFLKSANVEVPGTIEKKYLKIVKIHNKGITSLRLCDKVIASSSEDGTILFHDQFLRLLYWLPKLKLDSLVSISFNVAHVPTKSDPFSSDFHEDYMTSDKEFEDVFYFEEDDIKKKSDSDADDEYVESSHRRNFKIKKTDSNGNPSDCTIHRRPFIIRDFFFLTATGRIGYVSHKRKKVKYYLHQAEAPILSIDCHPKKNFIVVSNSQGRLVLYEYIKKKLLVKSTQSEPVTTLKYSNLGHYLMAGLQSGLLLELDPLLLNTKAKIEAAKFPIVKICFSPNDDLMAFYDQSRTVYVYLRKVTETQWNFMGKYIAHSKPIRNILFVENQDNSQSFKYPRLFTMGEGRMLVEYDMKNLEESNLKLLNAVRIEQTAIPSYITSFINTSKTPQFLISNSEYKLKVVDVNTLICQKTTLGPTADTPINFMKQIHDCKSDESKQKLIYSTEKHIGLRILPPSGNPFEGMGMVAHPEKLISVAISHDDMYVFTAGMNDANILMWMVNSSSVEVASRIGGVGLEPFLSLIEGGADSFLFREMEDFFYYAQIIHQGEDANTEREVSKNLALCEIADLFRALGYYPTDLEIDNLIYELKHLNYEKTGEIAKEVSFEECFKAFLNHKPVQGISLSNVNKALLAIADVSDPTDAVIEREKLYKALEEKGEAMNHAEVVGYLCILLWPKDENNPLPPTLSLQEFAESVLGVDLTVTEETVRQITHSFEVKNDA